MDNTRTIKITYPDDETLKKYDSALIYELFNYVKKDSDSVVVLTGNVELPDNPQIYYYEDLIDDENKLEKIKNTKMIDLDVDDQIDIQIKKFSIKNKKNLRANGTSYIKIDDNKYIKYEGILCVSNG